MIASRDLLPYQLHGVRLLQPRGPAELRDLEAQPPFSGQRRRLPVDAGQMQPVPQLLPFQSSSSLQIFQNDYSILACKYKPQKHPCPDRD